MRVNTAKNSVFSIETTYKNSINDEQKTKITTKGNLRTIGYLIATI